MSAQNTSPMGVYDCEINLRFRLIEERAALTQDSDSLLEVLLEAFSCGEDNYLEATYVSVDAKLISDTDVSPKMRQQLMRLRNIAA